MKNKKYIVMVIATIIVIFIIVMISINSENNNNIVTKNEINNVVNNIDDGNIIADNLEEIENMKNEINASGDTNIYQIEEEYDGRKILQVKSEVQFDVDLAGIIKNSKPEENEINDLVGQAPQNNGIWISKQSREEFANLLKANDINDFTITDDGYLQINNNSNNSNLASKLINMLNANKLYVINMIGIAYERDYISGEIVEYPFEDMDPYQILQPYQKDNKIILELTTNKLKKLNENEILDAITYY